MVPVGRGTCIRRFRRPIARSSLQAVWSLGAGATGSYRALFTRVIYTEWIFFALLAFGVVLLRRRPGYAPAWRMPLVPLAPMLFVDRVAADRRQPDPRRLANAAIGLGDCRDRIPGLLSLGCRNHVNENRLSTITTIPPEYLAAVKKGPTKVRMDYDAEGNPRLHYPGDYNILVPGHRDLDYREGVLKKHGVDKQVITFTTPGTHFEEPATAVDDGGADQQRVWQRR